MNRIVEILAFCFFVFTAGYLLVEYLNYSKTATPGAFELREARLPISAAQYNTRYNAPENKYTIENFQFSSNIRQYHIFQGTNDKSRPIMVLLHGSQRNGAAMLDMWEGEARKNDLILLAPDSAVKRGWSLRNDPASFLNSMIAHAREKYGFSGSDVFLFGHSSGAIHATYMSIQT